MSEESKPHVVKSHDIRLDSDYVSWVHDVKQRYVSAQIKSAVKVNSFMVLLPFSIFNQGFNGDIQGFGDLTDGGGFTVVPVCYPVKLLVLHVNFFAKFLRI